MHKVETQMSLLELCTISAKRARLQWETTQEICGSTAQRLNCISRPEAIT
jgi:hypothetical protein